MLECYLDLRVPLTNELRTSLLALADVETPSQPLADVEIAVDFVAAVGGDDALALALECLHSQQPRAYYVASAAGNPLCVYVGLVDQGLCSS